VLLHRPVVLAIAGLVLLLVMLVAGVAAGTVAIAPGDTIGILAHRILGLNVARTWSAADETIVMDLRLPRVLTAMTVGVGLAVSGATFQGLLRNPLADPYVLGTASGAALGAAVAECESVNTYPILATPEDDVLVGAAIVLPDHPQLAPESRGNLFDGTEIEEALVLHVMALSADEREQIAAGDPAIRELVARTVAATPEDLVRLHGRTVLRDPGRGEL